MAGKGEGTYETPNKKVTCASANTKPRSKQDKAYQRKAELRWRAGHPARIRLVTFHLTSTS
jgi:hypothetical protein